MYQIAILDDKSQLKLGQTFEVSCYNWGGTYRPKTIGSLVFIKEEGFFLHMRCDESDPLRRYTKANDPVYTDSCMEAFLSFYPGSEKSGYINFEMNANGALLCAYGESRHNRQYITDAGITPPVPKVKLEASFWELALMIPLTFIKAVYGRCDFEEAQVLRGNFFKVGENDVNLHFASFMPITAEKPDFHLPNFFSNFILTKPTNK